MKVRRSMFGGAVMDGLFKNSAFLVLNMGVGAIAGFAFVLLGSHVYGPTTFGYAVSLMGTTAVVVSVGTLGLPRAIARFLATTPNPQRLVRHAVLGVVAASLISVAVAEIALGLAGVTNYGWRSVTVAVVVAAVTAALKAISDSVFVALRRSEFVLWTTVISWLVRLTLLVILRQHGVVGVVTAQACGLAVSNLFSFAVIARMVRPGQQAEPAPTGMAGFAVGSWISDLVGGLPTSALPVVIVERLSPQDGAAWYTVMQFVALMLALIGAIDQAMFAELAAGTGHRIRTLFRATGLIYSLLVPVALALVVMAPDVLALFDPSYRSAAGTFRLMTLFVLFAVLNFQSGSVLQMEKRVGYILSVNVANAVVVIGSALLFAGSLRGVAVGWILGELVNIACFGGRASAVVARWRREEVASAA